LVNQKTHRLILKGFEHKKTINQARISMTQFVLII
jgi:hypothetical protein